MKRPRIVLFILGLGLVGISAAKADEWLDQASEALRYHTADGVVRAQLSGSLELEGYYASNPVADLIFSDKEFLFNPRLNLYLDAQVGRRVYGFAQLRADRGFDPSDESPELRLDEYALRLELWSPGRLKLQVGKFATVVGNWVARHDAWNNPFVTAPLPYDNLTGVWDIKPAPSVVKLREWAHVWPASAGAAVYADKIFRLPVVWGPVYAHGVAVSGAWGRFTYAAELKANALASHPAEWKKTSLLWDHPVFGARVGYRPNEMWEAGISVSQGEYLNHAADAMVPVGLNRQAYRQRVVAQDLSFAWHRFQFWAEAYATQFEIPRVADVSTFAYYLEAKYKFTPQFSGAVRWNQQLYDEVQLLSGQKVAWGRQVWRVDVAPTYRFSAHTQLKLQYSLRHEKPSPEKITHSLAVQFTVRF